MSIVIPVDEFLNTTLTIGTKQFPLEIFNDDLNNFENRLVNWHKQKTIEMSVKMCIRDRDTIRWQYFKIKKE